MFVLEERGHMGKHCSVQSGLQSRLPDRQRDARRSPNGHLPAERRRGAHGGPCSEMLPRSVRPAVPPFLVHAILHLSGMHAADSLCFDRNLEGCVMAKSTLCFRQ